MMINKQIKISQRACVIIWDLSHYPFPYSLWSEVWLSAIAQTYQVDSLLKAFTLVLFLITILALHLSKCLPSSLYSHLSPRE